MKKKFESNVSSEEVTACFTLMCRTNHLPVGHGIGQGFEKDINPSARDLDCTEGSP